MAYLDPPKPKAQAGQRALAGRRFTTSVFDQAILGLTNPGKGSFCGLPMAAREVRCGTASCALLPMTDDRACQRRCIVDVPLTDRSGSKPLGTPSAAIFPATTDGLARLKPVRGGDTITLGAQSPPADGSIRAIVTTRNIALPWGRMNNHGSSIVCGHCQAPTGCAAGDTAMAVVLQVRDRRRARARPPAAGSGQRRSMKVTAAAEAGALIADGTALLPGGLAVPALPEELPRARSCRALSPGVEGHEGIDVALRIGHRDALHEQGQQFGLAGDVQLLVNAPAMNLHRAFRDAQPLADQLAAVAEQQVAQHHVLARSQHRRPEARSTAW